MQTENISEFGYTMFVASPDNSVTINTNSMSVSTCCYMEYQEVVHTDGVFSITTYLNACCGGPLQIAIEGDVPSALRWITLSLNVDVEEVAGLFKPYEPMQGDWGTWKEEWRFGYELKLYPATMYFIETEKTALYCIVEQQFLITEDISTVMKNNNGQPITFVRYQDALNKAQELLDNDDCILSDEQYRCTEYTVRLCDENGSITAGR